MSYFNNFKKSQLNYQNDIQNIQINIDEIIEGVSQSKEFFYNRDGETIKIFDRLCDHAGGKLSLKGNGYLKS